MTDLEAWTQQAKEAMKAAVHKATRLAEREPEDSPIRKLAVNLHTIYDSLVEGPTPSGQAIQEKE